MAKKTNFNGKGPGKNLSTADKRLTTCSDCKYGIFEGQEYIWTNRGLIHNPCIKRGSNEAKNDS